MAHSLSFHPFPGYGLSYDLLVQFCSLFTQTHPQHSQLLGPTCIIRGDELSEEETRWLEQQPDVTMYEQCVLIDFDGKGSDEERRLQTSGTLWCANDEEGFAYVALPAILTFLSRRALE